VYASNCFIYIYIYLFIYLFVCTLVSAILCYVLSGPRSRYSDTLRAGRSGDQIPLGWDFPSRPDWLRDPPSPSCSECAVFPGGKTAEEWCCHSPPTSALLRMIRICTFVSLTCLHRHVIAWLSMDIRTPLGTPILSITTGRKPKFLTNNNHN
jgi:hypothetical protein